jgi:CheY-like chemotaxis protein
MEAVGRLAGGVAHDFNNLLTVVAGYTEVALCALPGDHPARPPVEEVRDAGDRAARLTRQLLALGRRQVLAPRALDLNEVVADLGRMLRRLLGEDVELTTDLRPGLWPVWVDRGQVEQVLVNLAVNARDAMPAGGKLTVRTANAEVREGRYVLLEVSDTGCGMTDEVKARVFEPFFTTKGPGKGTGLGLAVIHGVVEQSGGFVEVDSGPGQGATFRVYLPRTVRAAAGGKLSPAEGWRPTGAETVLVVEDEPAVRLLTCRVLREGGYTVLEAGGGPEAARAVEGHGGPVHLLVTDVVLPGVGGRELAESLRAGHPGLLVLFVSGYTEDAVVRHGIREEQVHYLQKPFSPSGLLRKVRQVLDTPAGG